MVESKINKQIGKGIKEQVTKLAFPARQFADHCIKT
jgi:hypothetical protein